MKSQSTIYIYQSESHRGGRGGEERCHVPRSPSNLLYLELLLVLYHQFRRHQSCKLLHGAEVVARCLSEERSPLISTAFPDRVRAHPDDMFRTVRRLPPLTGRSVDRRFTCFKAVVKRKRALDIYSESRKQQLKWLVTHCKMSSEPFVAKCQSERVANGLNQSRMVQSIREWFGM